MAGNRDCLVDIVTMWHSRKTEPLELIQKWQSVVTFAGNENRNEKMQM